MEVAALREGIRIEGAQLDGRLVVPGRAKAVVLMLRGKGGASAQVRSIGEILRAGGLGTLLLDVGSESVVAGRAPPPRIDPLVSRIVKALEWIAARPALAGLPVGALAGGVGAAAVLQAASTFPARIDSIVAHGARLELLGDATLVNVAAATLLIVGGDDHELQRVNRRALACLTCVRRLEVLPDTADPLAQPGALDTTAHLATGWFLHQSVRRAMR